jgi:hypothetical protein
MPIEILYLAIPAIVLFGLCTATDKTVTIRNSEGTHYKPTDSDAK